MRTICQGGKKFWPAPLGLAQLSDLVLERTSFLIKKQGTTEKRNDTYFMLLFFFLTLGFSVIGSLWIPCDFFQLYWLRLFSCVFHTPSNCVEHMVRKACFAFFHLLRSWWVEVFFTAFYVSMNLKGLINLRDKPFGRVFPIEIQLYIMFWAACAETNDLHKKMNEQLLRIPVCLYTSIPLSVNFTPSTGYQPWMKTIQRFEIRRNQRCHHCFRRNTQQVSVSAFIFFP